MMKSNHVTNKQTDLLKSRIICSLSYSDIMTNVAHCVGPCSATQAAWVLSASLGAGPFSAFLLSSDLSPEDAGGSHSPSLAVTLQPKCEAGGVPPQARLVILRYLRPGHSPQVALSSFHMGTEQCFSIYFESGAKK